MHSVLKSTLKIGAAGATIAVIGALMLVVSESGGKPEVQTASADITSLGFGGATNTQRFVEALDSLGMEEGRAYDWNGNKVFFSTHVTKETPEEVLVRFQKQFVQSGINERPYYESLKNIDDPDPNHWKTMPRDQVEDASERVAEHWQRDSTFFSGGIVPITISDKYVAMAGTVTQGKADGGVDFMKEMKDAGKRPITDHVGAMRYIEATRMGRATRVNAIWTDEDIDFSKFHASKKSSNVSMSAKVPSCMGCTRLMRFAGESKGEEGYVMSIYEGTLSVPKTVDFYERSMANRGWRLAPSTKMLRKLEAEGIKPRSNGELMSFARGDEFVTVLVHPDGGKTSVQVMESP